MITRKVFVLRTPDGAMMSDIDKTTFNTREAITWVSEEAAVLGVQRCKGKLRDDLRLEQIELPFPAPIPARYLSL